MKSEAKYHYSLTLLFFVVSYIGIYHHELWLDEAQHWLLARDSVSLTDLVENTRLDGHPILWNILLYCITRFTLNPLWMQVLHISISTTVVYLFLRKAPFPLIFKMLFIFGYFMIFEYNLISRNYGLGVLFLFLACSVFKERKEKFALLSVYLALAANVHLMFSAVAFAFFLTLLFENFNEKRLMEKQFLMGYFIFGMGLLLLIFQLLPSNPTWFFSTIKDIPLSEKIIPGFISLFKGLIAIPDFTTIHFWNSNLFVNLSKPLSGIIGLMLYILPCLLFKKKNSLFFVYSAFLGIEFFFFVTQRNAMRFDGINYIIIIITLWIEYYFKENDYLVFLKSKNLTFLKTPIIYSILVIQLFSGIYAYAMDFKYPFTASKEVANYLESKKLNKNTIVSVSCDATAISPYLRKKIWFLCTDSDQSYCQWELICSNNISHEYLVDMLTNYLDKKDYAIYVSNYSINDKKSNNWISINNKFKVRFLKKFDTGIIRNGQYYVYEIAKINFNAQ
ncbi:MAG TPA: hypothetical protein PKN96_00030 [Flavobacterium sp.]|uniref:hypothetical protein n=1 Tax=Flavobacterium sp. TaxID=239 RepID=UPI002BE47DD6|nr:hypothetical protein [Flavobacterium sp.]HNP31656.1 hypothetical protein [Flavobacterium sp.]